MALKVPFPLSLRIFSQGKETDKLSSPQMISSTASKKYRDHGKFQYRQVNILEIHQRVFR